MRTCHSFTTDGTLDAGLPDARRVATSLGLAIAGPLSVLIEVKKLGRVPQVAPIVGQMIAQGRRISARLRAAMLPEVGE